MTTVIMCEPDLSKSRIEAIDNELEELNKKVIVLEDERNELIKSVRKLIKAELQETADKYGFVIRNKTKSSSKSKTEEAVKSNTTD
ncbi:hypothetical protein [Methylotenera sp.]|uniref:hypothetical protein n=1 Tax=Methylotenera sp. TaxID=2051956 RepID=UPI0027292D49|nr:hypothetical protein [Methylotenera sp.]MDO9126999.1 hypothetical protein [Parvibaculum sp.]MDP2230827.1 hypothetical protein [Methylotenera sp.]